nr:MAG TPA: baseplate wedge protein [Caudoviricetes sp.]
MLIPLFSAPLFFPPFFSSPPFDDLIIPRYNVVVKQKQKISEICLNKKQKNRTTFLCEAFFFYTLKGVGYMKQYRTVQGDTWDLIAKKQYGDEKKLDILMMNNFSLLGYVVFPAGVLVDVPELPDEEQQGWPEWRNR